jgi:hypothetical protein
LSPTVTAVELPPSNLWRRRDEIVRINDEARDRALQAAMLVPVLAGLFGFANSFRMIRLPDIEPFR